MSVELTIRNFKSVGDVTLALRQGLNILVGPNGSGKTCLLSSLNFIRNMFRLGVAQAVARSGGHQRVYRRRSKRIIFEITQEYGERVCRRRRVPCQLRWHIEIGQGSGEGIAMILKESLEIRTIEGRQGVRLFLFSVDRTNLSRIQIRDQLCKPTVFGRDLFSEWRERYGSASKIQIHALFRKTELRSLRSFARRNPDVAFLPVVAHLDRKIMDTHSLFLFLDEYNIVPGVARAATEQLPYARMGSDGSSVSEVIGALQAKQYRKLAAARFDEVDLYEYRPYRRRRYYGRKRRVFVYGDPWSPIYRYRIEPSLVRALENINSELASAVRPITEVRVAIDPTTGRRFVVFKAGSETFHPEEVSDGTMKWLCLLVSLFVPFCRVYLLEEPENFLHPWMQQRLVDIMRRQAQEAGTIFLLSSHSTTLVNAARPEEVLLVRQTHKGTQLSQVEELSKIRQALAESSFQLGDLWVSGAIGGVPAGE